MESLLSVAFDNLSSRDSARNRKGLRQIEGLLAQICLSSSRLSPHKKRNHSNSQTAADAKTLKDLRKDAAFREFFRLQEGFRWNGTVAPLGHPSSFKSDNMVFIVASRLISLLERLLSTHHPSPALLTSTLSNLQGLLLLHPPSRWLFNREDYMTLLLDSLETSPPHALLVLVTALLATPRNTRVFESVDGLLTVTSLFKSRQTSRETKMRVLEFLYFYLMPEAAPTKANSAPNTEVSGKAREGLGMEHARTHSGEMMDEEQDEGERETKSTLEKQKLLGRHLSNVDELVQDLRENAVFGATAGG